MSNLPQLPQWTSLLAILLSSQAHLRSRLTCKLRPRHNFGMKDVGSLQGRWQCYTRCCVCDLKDQEYRRIICMKTYAMACPSEVAVPRPSSSRATRECFVAERCHHPQHPQVYIIIFPHKMWSNHCSTIKSQSYANILLRLCGHSKMKD